MTSKQNTKIRYRQMKLSLCSKGKRLTALNLKHQIRAIRNSTQHLASAKKALDTYFIQNKINTIAASHMANQHSASWKVINIWGARKIHLSNSKKVSAEKRKSNWLTQSTNAC